MEHKKFLEIEFSERRWGRQIDNTFNTILLLLDYILLNIVSTTCERASNNSNITLESIHHQDFLILHDNSIYFHVNELFG